MFWFFKIPRQMIWCSATGACVFAEVTPHKPIRAFVAYKAPYTFNENGVKQITTPFTQKLKPRVPLETFRKAVCEEFTCIKEQIIVKGRKKNKAREVSICLARDMSGISCKELGDYFGGVSGALITTMHKRISEDAAKNSRL